MEAAFLELVQPDLETAAARLVGLGVQRLVIIPYFLTLGIHMERDLPRIAERISMDHKGLDIRIAPPLDGHPALLDILEDRARQALACSTQQKLDNNALKFNNGDVLNSR